MSKVFDEASGFSNELDSSKVNEAPKRAGSYKEFTENL